MSRENIEVVRDQYAATNERDFRTRDFALRLDVELVRVAAYAGLRRGELLVLRWRDVDFAGSALTVARATSAGVESTTKSGRVRRVPLADQAAAALDRLSRREHFTAPNELVFCKVLGRSLDGSALRRRYRRAQIAAEVRPLRFHDLRHTFGSLLAACGVDVVTIQKAMATARSAPRAATCTPARHPSRPRRSRRRSRRRCRTTLRRSPREGRRLERVGLGLAACEGAYFIYERCGDVDGRVHAR